MPAETTYRVDPVRASWRETRGRLVVTDRNRGLLFQVSGSGIDIWNALVAGTTVAALVALLTDRYDVQHADAAIDAEQFVVSLVEQGLVTAADPPSGTTDPTAPDSAG